MSWLLGLTLLAILQVTNGTVLHKDKEFDAFKTKSEEVSLSARQFLCRSLDSVEKEVGQLLNLRIQPEGQSWGDKPAYVPRPRSSAEWSVKGSDGSLTWNHGGKKPLGKTLIGQLPVELTNIEVAFSNSKESTLTMDINRDLRQLPRWQTRVLAFESGRSTTDTRFSIFLFNGGSAEVDEGGRRATFTTSDGYFDIWMAVCDMGSWESCLDNYSRLDVDKRFLDFSLEKAEPGAGYFANFPKFGVFHLDQGKAEFSSLVDNHEDTSFKASFEDGHLTIELVKWADPNQINWQRQLIKGIAVDNVRCHNPEWDLNNFEELKKANVFLRVGIQRETFAVLQSIDKTLLVRFMELRLMSIGEPIILKFNCQASTDHLENQNERKNSKKSKKAHAKKSKKAHAKKSKKGKRLGRKH